MKQAYISLKLDYKSLVSASLTKSGFLYALFAVLLATVFISCEKDIEFKGTISDPVPVLNSLLTPDSAVSVHLSQSRFVLGESKPMSPITNATVSLSVNGDLKEELIHEANGVFRGSYFPRPGDEIAIEVEADGYDRVESRTIIPRKPHVTVTDSTVTISEEDYSPPMEPDRVYRTTYRSMQVQLKLTDAPDTENYYYIKANQNYYQDGKLLRSLPLEVKLSELLKNNISSGGFIFEELFDEGDDTSMTENLFPDFLVNGKDIFFDFSFHDTLNKAEYVRGEKVSGDNPELTVEYIIEIAEISKDLYQYVISGSQAVRAKDNGPFSEPVQVHTNIQNGIGILGAYTPYRFVSRFQTRHYPYDYHSYDY